ncbi:MAG: peptidoglycan DD-metalloendopeptidase family protein [Chitinivibrionales bacterium]|nr:peptidoglycan DD-metalloendopeptidase family protein [Chitinivibrionales bacterium]MBD3397395.1 peptidoglycan DD-metalloendopeptidase family protein [Chitinivibrionales bacterium]
MAKKKPKNYTVMLVPDDNTRPLSFHVGGFIVRAAAFFVIVFVAGLGVLLFRAGDIGVRLQLVSSLREENARLKEDNRKLLAVAKKLHAMERMSAYLRRLATAVGEGEAGAAGGSAGAAAKEDIFAEDSFDNFLQEVRVGESDEFRDLGEADATPELLLGSMPNIRPVKGWITKTFMPEGKGGMPAHTGVDFAAPEGTLIHASAPGTVDDVINDKYFGLLVHVKHHFGFETRYGHCSQILVSPGDVVERGQAIALVGNTGHSSGPHLHYEVIHNGKHEDPMKYILQQTAHP